MVAKPETQIREKIKSRSCRNTGAAVFCFLPSFDLPILREAYDLMPLLAL